MIFSLSLEDHVKWTELIKSFKDYDVYYLPEYVNAFKLNGDGEPIAIYYEDNNLRAINVVIKRDIAKCSYFQEKIKPCEYFDIITPYGYGGWIIELKNSDNPNCFDEMSCAYLEWCKTNNIVDEFVRFHPLLKNWNFCNELYDIKFIGNTVSIDTNSICDVWNNFTSKNRNVIRKAQNNGLKVYWCRESSIIEPFMDIYNATMDKDHANSYYYFHKEFYNSILEDLKYNSMWFYAEVDNEIAAIAIFLFCNGKMHYHLSASRKEYQHLAPTNLLLYEAACWAVNNNYKKIHLGGGVGASQDNLYKFKKAFNKNDDCEFWIGKKIYDIDSYNKLVGLRKSFDVDFCESATFFPLYRS